MKAGSSARRWEERFAAFEESFQRLAGEVEQLGDDLGAVYALVVEGMRASAVSMEAAASALNELRSLMGEVT